MSNANERSSLCKICSVPTLICHYGVKSCEPCKVFFRRIVTNPMKKLQCDFDGQCQINLNNRHICSACRFQKCLDVGMSPEMIRAPRGKRSTKVIRSSGLCQEKHRDNIQSQQLRRLNLVERDISLLNNDQWILLSNLIHSYDEHDALPFANNFMKELNSKPSKLRFKINSTQIMELVNIFYQRTEPFIRSNDHFTSLSSDDRSIVLHGAVDNVSCLGGGFLLRQSGLITSLAFCQGLENTFGSIPFDLTLKAIALLDQDIDLVKLTLSLFAFCTNNCTLFDETNSIFSIGNYQGLLRTQNMYAELIWKYLLYRYNFTQAVKRFTNLVQCLIVALTVRTHLQAVKNHTDAVNSLIEKIEQQQMSINDE